MTFLNLLCLFYRHQLESGFAIRIIIEKGVNSEIILVDCVKVIVRVNQTFIEGIYFLDVIAKKKIIKRNLNVRFKQINIFGYRFNVLLGNLFKVFGIIKFGIIKVVRVIKLNVFTTVTRAEEINLFISIISDNFLLRRLGVVKNG